MAAYARVIGFWCAGYSLDEIASELDMEREDVRKAVWTALTENNMPLGPGWDK